MDSLPCWLLIAIVGVCAAETNCGPAEYKNKKGECCPMCGKGYVVYRDCTEMSSTTCIPCVGDTYMSEPNGLNKCFKCKTCDMNQGLYTLQKCTTFSDAVCAVLNGYYCGSIENNECTFGVKHSVCFPGQGVKTPGTVSTDTECEDCKEGYFSMYGINCTEHTNCAVHGEVLEENGSLTQDNKCEKPHRGRGGLIAAVLVFLFATILFAPLQRLYPPDSLSTKPVQETNDDKSRQPEEDVDRSMGNTMDANDDRPSGETLQVTDNDRHHTLSHNSAC